MLKAPNNHSLVEFGCVKLQDMETTTLTIRLPKEISSELAKKAKSSGKNVAEYVEDLVSKQVKRPTFRELFADVRETITIDDDELEVAIRSAREEIPTTRSTA